MKAATAGLARFEGRLRRVAAAIDEVFRTRGTLLGRLARAEGPGVARAAAPRRKARTPR